ncbi:MAG: glycine/betaine ABC transporter substrate-binding protein [Butyrivibrio sp.]|nr:glycine/betaine ABC transporter substrate-binding protein [Butyrivibrio sp.]
MTGCGSADSSAQAKETETATTTEAAAAETPATENADSADTTAENAAENTETDTTAANESKSLEKVRIGSKDFTENEIVAELYALALEDAGYEVERVFDISSSVIHQSIVSDEIDLYPEYTGTGLLSILQLDLVTDPDEVYRIVKEKYEEQFGITWLDYAKANDGQGIFISKAASDEYGIKTLSDLQANAENIRFASQGEFDEREDGIPGLEKVYGEFNWKSSKVYDNGLKYEVVENDEADAAPAYTTEGQLSQTDKFVLLEDDKQVWPPYNLAPVVRDNVLESAPDIAEVLNKVSAALDTPTITALNAKVDVDKEEYEDVAKEFFDSIK